MAFLKKLQKGFIGRKGLRTAAIAEPKIKKFSAVKLDVRNVNLLIWLSKSRGYDFLLKPWEDSLLKFYYLDTLINLQTILGGVYIY